MIQPPRWTAAEDSVLRGGWADGISVDAIARALPARSRNAVTGRALRLGLPRRQSPIRGFKTQDEARAALAREKVARAARAARERAARDAEYAEAQAARDAKRDMARIERN